VLHPPRTADVIRTLLALEQSEQESWPREPVTGWRAWLGDPRNERPAGAGAGGSGGDGGAGGGTGEGAGGAGEGGGGEGGGDGGAEVVTLSRAELDSLKKAVGTSNSELRKVQAELEKRDREKAESEGQFKELYETEKAERAREKAEAQAAQRDSMIVKVAERLRFKNPAIAAKSIDLDGIKTPEDEAKAEKALNDLAKREAWMVNDPPRVQRGGAGAGGTAGGTGGKDDPAPSGVDRVRSYYDRKSEGAGRT
jgi:hypothetical protein